MSAAVCGKRAPSSLEELPHTAASPPPSKRARFRSGGGSPSPPRPRGAADPGLVAVFRARFPFVSLEVMRSARIPRLQARHLLRRPLHRKRHRRMLRRVTPYPHLASLAGSPRSCCFLGSPAPLRWLLHFSPRRIAHSLISCLVGSVAPSLPSPTSALARPHHHHHHMWAPPAASAGFSQAVFLNSAGTGAGDAGGIGGFVQRMGLPAGLKLPGGRRRREPGRRWAHRVRAHVHRPRGGGHAGPGARAVAGRPHRRARRAIAQPVLPPGRWLRGQRAAAAPAPSPSSPTPPPSYASSRVSAAVAVDVSSPTRFLVLNAAELAVDRASIRFQDLAPAEVSQFADDEILVLRFGKELPLGEGVLRMDFNGTLNDQMRGFYRSKYNGETKNMAVTQFESVDARRCFPCWDEPAFKAKFKLTLDVPSELVALSDMPVANLTVVGPIKTVHYEESPLMSTYLVAIVVGLFDYIEGTKVRVYTQVGKSNQGKFALDVGVKSLDLYKDYFDTPYPLLKLDMVAIPDFAAGAMENYGLVTFREVALLFDEQSSSASNKQSVAITVAHELAHQWFGNLVTMEWWTHLWLNEGFATWMSYLAVDSFFPQWNVWTQFLGSTTTALRLDSLAESHPIEVEIHHANEVDAIFDAISYDKGASVLRMLQSYLGAECFQVNVNGDKHWMGVVHTHHVHHY